MYVNGCALWACELKIQNSDHQPKTEQWQSGNCVHRTFMEMTKEQSHPFNNNPVQKTGSACCATQKKKVNAFVVETNLERDSKEKRTEPKNDWRDCNFRYLPHDSICGVIRKISILCVTVPFYVFIELPKIEFNKFLRNYQKFDLLLTNSICVCLLFFINVHFQSMDRSVRLDTDKSNFDMKCKREKNPFTSK